MKINSFSLKWLIIVYSLLLTSCGDSGLSVLAGGGIGGTGDVATIAIKSSSSVNVGPITHFGSVFVNGIEYDTTEALIFVDDQTATEDALELGMIVQVEGYINADGHTGVAQQIKFNEDVVGPIQQIAEDKSRLIVLGQTIQIDELTVFAGVTDVEELVVGQVVAVSGLMTAEGYIFASRIALQSPTVPFRVRGRAQQIDPVNQTLTIGDLTVNYQQVPASESSESNAGGQAKMGMEWVNVQGTLIDNQLMAEQFTTEGPPLTANTGTYVTLRGMITRFDHAEDFEIAHTPVTTTVDTQLTSGTIADLAPNVHLRASGQFNEEGVLVLEEVTFLKASLNPRIDIDANVQAIDMANNQLTLLGIPVQTTALTLFQDKQQVKNAFSLEDLYIGNHVKVHGSLDLSTGVPLIDLLQRQPESTTEQVTLGGPAETVDVASHTLEILGVTIMVDANTQYFDEYPITPGTEEPLPPPETALTVEQFFSKVQAVAPLVTVRGRLVGEVIVAEILMIQPL